MSDNPNVGKQMQSIRDLAMEMIYGQTQRCSKVEEADKQITFIEALLAKKLGLKVYGITEVGSIKEWNPENQNIVSWYAIENGKWFIRGDKNG